MQMIKQKKKQKKRISWNDAFYALKDMDNAPREERVLAYRKVINTIRIAVVLIILNILIYSYRYITVGYGRYLDIAISNVLLFIGTEISLIPFRLFAKKRSWDKKGNRYIFLICFSVSLVFAALAGYSILKALRVI